MAVRSMGVPTWAAKQDIQRKDGYMDFLAIPAKQGIFPIHSIEDSPHLSTHNDYERTSLPRQVLVLVSPLLMPSARQIVCQQLITR